MASTPKLLEILQGYVCCLGESQAEVEIEVEGQAHCYLIPAQHLQEHGIQEGDDFLVEIYDDETATVKPLVFYGPQPQVEFPTRDELEAQDDPW